MKRITNVERLKAILRSNTDVRYDATYGIADNDFYIYLTNGQEYLVKEGYSINWSDNEEIKIQERSMNSKKNFKDKIDKAEGFFDTLINSVESALETMGDSYLADKVEIEWAEIREIESV